MLFRSIYPQYKTLSPQQKSKRKQENQPAIKYPQEFQIIIRSDRSQYGNLYIGNLESAENLQMLQTLKINGILSVAKGKKVEYKKQLIRYYKYVPLPQNEEADIYEYLDESSDFLSNTLLLTNVLVHCISGQNRSGCVVTAFLIKSRRLSFEDAYNEVKSRRKMICLNECMKDQLKKYELDINNSGLRKNKYNMSMRVDTKVSNVNVNKSYFQDKIMESEGSVLSNKNNPHIEASRIKSQQTIRSKTCENNSKPNIVIHKPKSHTRQENPENSLEVQKEWKSLNANLLDKSFAKSKASKAFSKVSSVRFISQERQVTVQDDRPIPFEGDFELKMTNRTKQMRQQFKKRVNIIDKRNQSLNQTLIKLQRKFNTVNESNKLVLEKQLNQINQLRESMYKQYQQQRKIKIRQNAKSFHSNLQDYSQNYSKQNQSRISKSQISSDLE